MNRHWQISVILLCLIVLLAGCTGILGGAQPTPTLVPLPRGTLTRIPSAQVLQPTASAPGLTPTEARTPTPPPTAGASPSPMASPTTTPTSMPTATPTSAMPLAVVTADRLNVRTGPGTAYPRIGQLEKGTQVEIAGRNEEATWWEIAFEGAEGERAWIASEYTTANITADEVPTVAVSPPPPTPVPAPRFTGKIAFQESSGGRIFTINADGTGLTYLTDGMDPDWSPDGTKIAFARWAWDPPGIFVIHADGSGEEQIVRDYKAKGPRWSPDSTRIVFTSERKEPGEEICFRPPYGPGPEICFTPEEKRWKLSVLDLATGHIMDPHCDPFSFAPDWSPDGTRLVYDGIYGLRPADPIEGHDQKGAFIDYDHRDMYPAWSPDGTRIAFMFRQHDHWEIYVVNADGTGRMRLTESPLFEPPQNSVAPEWSPDGQWIAFLTDRRGKWEVWVMRPDGSQQQPLFPPGTLEGISFRYDAQSEHVLDWWMPR